MFWVAVLLSALSVEATVVTIEQGTLNGTYLKARNGRTFNAFFKLPYAEPPVGNLRFKAPVEPKPWSGVWNASVAPQACIQYVMYTNGTDGSVGSEDCLYLNVYSPWNTRRGENLPVIVYLYGGAFEYGSNMRDGPQYFMGSSSDVIMVSPNYRLGVFGFLSTGDTVIPGNFGQKDQNMALRWVQKNIYSFGGDPNRVTLYGHSSGAMSAHLHSLSPMSRGLFQKVILQSGTGVSPAAYFGRDVARSVAKEFAIKAGCANTNTSQNIYDCLMQKDATVALLNPVELYIWGDDPSAAIRPSVEDKNVPDAFLTEDPNNIEYHSPNLPWIIGMTTGEMAYRVATFLGNGGKLASELDENFKLLFPVTLQYLWNTKPKHLDYISQTLRTRYFRNKAIGAETANEMTNMYTDGVFGVSMIDAILKYPGPKYIYLYDYVSNYSTQNMLVYYDKFLGVSHSSDLNVMFREDESAAFLTKRDMMFGDELIKRWTNFARTGNPNRPVKINESIMGFWEPMSSKKIEYLFINLNGSMRSDLYKGTYQFWKSLPIGSKYYRD